MMKMSKITIFCLVFDSIIAFILVFLNLKWFLNSQIAFFCTLLIIYTSYKNYKNKIQDEIYSGKYDNLDDKFEKQKKPMFFLTFFAPFKILSYILLILSMFLLVKFEFFHGVAFIIGVSIVPISILMAVFINSISKSI